MKTHWPLVAVPLLGGLLVAGVCIATGPDVPPMVLRLNDTIVFALAGGASLFAARAFQAGDYLRRAWLLMSTCYLLLVFDTLVFGVDSPFRGRDIGDTGALVSGTVTILANLANVASLIIVARAWRVAGLTLVVKPATFIGIEAAIAVVAFSLLGPTVVHQLFDALHDRPDQLHGLASTLGDLVSMLVIAPLLLTAFSFRGGSLAWPWSLLTLSALCWLGVDGADALGRQFLWPKGTVLVTGDTLRAVASLLQVAAAWAQRDAIRG